MITYPIIQIEVGEQTLEFSGEEVAIANLIEEINPISVEIPISAIEFNIISSDTTLSMFDGEVFQLLSERLPVTVYESIDGENTFIGKFYLEEWENVSEYEFHFRAIDIIGVLDTIDYDGGFWSTATTLQTVLSAILDPIDVLFSVDATIQDVEISGWNPPGTYREAVQQVCFAAKATTSTFGSDRLLINPIEIPIGVYDRKVMDSEKLMEQSIKLQPLVTSIELISHNYTQGDELKTIFEKYLEPGFYKIVFDQPYYDIIIDGPGYAPELFITDDGEFIVTDDDEYIEVGGEYVFGPNSLSLDVQEAGTVTITGYPWIDSKRSFTFYESVEQEYANKNALKVDSATMINVDNAQSVLDQMRDYYRQRYTKNISLLPSETQIGDMLLTNTIYQKHILGIVQKMDFNLTGGYIAKTDMLGIEPAYIPPSESPVRLARTGIAVCGSDLMAQNMFREYE
jgi:hypothetical protein